MKAAFGFRPDDFFFFATANSLFEGRTQRRRRSVPHYFTGFQQFSEWKTEKTPRARLRIPIGSGQIAPSRSDGVAVSSDAHVERMHFPVESIGRKSERVLTVQFLGDSSER